VDRLQATVTQRMHAALALFLTLVLAGCAGEKKESLPPSLSSYRGHGISAGHPKAWRPPAAGQGRVVPEAVFEVIDPVSTTRPGTAAAFDVLAYTDRTATVDELVFSFVQLSRTAPNFTLLAQRLVKIGNGTATEVSKEYDIPRTDAAPLRIRAVDWFIQPGEAEPVVNIRVGFTLDRYDEALVADIRESISIGGGGA
jgi:hypothetical protein